jgi:4-alpha-glucanotransferase
MGIGLIADLAVGADGGGSQAWSRQDELLANLTVGAPPDILNRAGQGWGISAFSPEGLKRNGFRAFIEMLRANFAHAGGLRIDHVMGLQRLWVIPMARRPGRRLPVLPGGRPAAPARPRVPPSPGHRTRRRPGHRARRAARKLIARSILGMRVLLFEQRHDGQFKPILDWPDNALAPPAPTTCRPSTAGGTAATSTGMPTRPDRCPPWSNGVSIACANARRCARP